MLEVSKATLLPSCSPAYVREIIMGGNSIYKMMLLTATLVFLFGVRNFGFKLVLNFKNFLKINFTES